MKNILIVGDYVDSGGGISVQMKYLVEMFKKDSDIKVGLFSTKSWYIFKPFVFIKLLLITRNYDKINVHGCSYWGFLTIIMSYYASKINNKRIIITYHGGAGKKFFDRHPYFLYYLRKADHLIVPSLFLGEYFKLKKLIPEIIPNHIDLSKFKFRLRNTISPKIITTRNLEPVYNIQSAISAFKIVKNKFPDATLTIVGDGSQKQKLEKFVQQNNIKDVTFIGKVDNSEVARLLDQNDILLNTSLDDNMPVSILEAQSSGLIVVSSNVGGISYIIKNRINGILINNINKDNIAISIKEIINKQKSSMQLIENAHKDILQYEKKDIKEKYRFIYLK